MGFSDSCITYPPYLQALDISTYLHIPTEDVLSSWPGQLGFESVKAAQETIDFLRGRLTPREVEETKPELVDAPMHAGHAGRRREFLAATILGIVFGLQCLRALFPSMVYVLKDRLGVSSIVLGLLGIGLFALAGFAPRWIRKRSPIRAAAMLAGFLAGVRALLQLWPGDPLGFLFLAATGSVVLLALLASLPAADAARIFLCGASIDLALHALRNTEDLHWASGPSDLVILVLAAAALAFSFRANRATEDVERATAPQFSGGQFVWGPFLFLHLELFGNVARFSARTSSPSDLSGAVLAASHAVALAMLAAGASRNRRWILAASAAALFSILNAEVPGSGAFFQIPLAIFTCAILLESALLRVSTASMRGVSFGFSSVLLILLTFAHYAGYDLPFPWTRIHVWVAAAVLLVLAAFRPRTPVASPTATPALAAIPLALAVMMAIAAVRDSREPHATGQPLRDSPRVVAFNLHAGFDELGTYAFPSMMEKLVAEDADVIALQEVSRGWLINGSADLFELARSAIPQPGVFAPSVGGDWGNAVFSKAAVQSVEEMPLPPPALSLSRAVLAVDLRTNAAQPFRVLATHFHHRTPDDSIRVLQARAVAEHFTGREPSVLLGDFNATPGSEAMEILRAAGWRDVLPTGGDFTYPSRAPDRRIDTILVRGPVEILAALVTPEWGSDHRAVVTELLLQP